MLLWGAGWASLTSRCHVMDASKNGKERKGRAATVVLLVRPTEGDFHSSSSPPWPPLALALGA